MLRGRLHDQKYISSHHNLKETLKLHDSNRKTLCNQYENAVFNLTNTRLHTFWSDWFQAMPVVL